MSNLSRSRKSLLDLVYFYEKENIMANQNSSIDFTTLVSASEAKATAQAAPLKHEMQQIAYAINTQASTGAFTVTYNNRMSKEAKEQLESKGYLVHNSDNSSLGREDYCNEYIISWK